MGFKPTPEINQRLRDAAAVNDRSISKEIEARLERSFSDDEARFDDFGGRGGYEIFRVIGSAASALGETVAKTNWWQEPRIFDTIANEICPALLSVFQKEIAKNKRAGTGGTLYWRMKLELAEPTDDGGKGKYRQVFMRISNMKF